MKVVWSHRWTLNIYAITSHKTTRLRPTVYRALLHTTATCRALRRAVGRPMPEAGNPNIREVLYQGYRIIYRLGPDAIEIAMVVHGSRDLSRFDGY